MPAAARASCPRHPRDLPKPQQASIDGRDRLDRLPPTTVVSDPELDRARQLTGDGDLLGAPSGERHAEVEGWVAGPAGTATAGLAAADLSLKEAAAQDFLQRRQGLGDPGPTQ